MVAMPWPRTNFVRKSAMGQLWFFLMCLLVRENISLGDFLSLSRVEEAQD